MFILFPIKVLAFDFYFSFSLIGSTTIPTFLNNTNLDSVMKIYNAEAFSFGISMPIFSKYLLSFQLGYLSKGIYGNEDNYFNLYNLFFKSVFSKVVLKSQVTQINFNFGVLFSYLLYALLRNRNYNQIIDIINISNFSPFNFGISLGYQFKFKKVAFEIGLNLTFIDENIRDSQYFLSGWIELSLFYFI